MLGDASSDWHANPKKRTAGFGAGSAEAKQSIMDVYATSKLTPTNGSIRRLGYEYVIFFKKYKHSSAF